MSLFLSALLIVGAVAVVFTVICVFIRLSFVVGGDRNKPQYTLVPDAPSGSDVVWIEGFDLDGGVPVDGGLQTG